MSKSSDQVIVNRFWPHLALQGTVPTNWRFANMAAKKGATRREWTKADLRELKSLARDKTPARRIGRKLRRTEGAVRQKAYAAGISLSLRGRSAKKRGK